MFGHLNFRDFDPNNEEDSMLVTGLITCQSAGLTVLQSAKNTLKYVGKKNIKRLKVFNFEGIDGIASIDEESIISVYLKPGSSISNEKKVELENSLIDAYSSSSVYPRAVRFLKEGSTI